MNSDFWKDGLIPPRPNSETSVDNPINGQRLLSLSKSKQRDNNDTTECASILSQLVAMYARRGLLQGDYDRAERILHSSSVQTNTSSSNNRKGPKKKPQSADGSKTSTFTEGAANSSHTEDENRVLGAVARILGGTHALSSDREKLSNQEAIVVKHAANLCAVVSERIKSAFKWDSCASAEFEIFFASGRSLLTGIVRTIRCILSQTSSESKAQNGSSLRCCGGILDDQDILRCLEACIRAAASMVGLFGTRLARNTELKSALCSIGWNALVMRYPSIQQASAKLLASVPLTGGRLEKQSPSEVWTSNVTTSVVSLSRLLAATIPSKKSGSAPREDESPVDKWIQHIREDMEDEKLQAHASLCCISGIVCFITALFDRDTIDTKQRPFLLGCRIAVDPLLDAIENMLSFTVSAERLYYTTKKRLRRETTPGGFLSPAAIVTEVANRVKLMGHQLLDATINTFGGPLLLPYGRRILRMSYAAIMTASSDPVRKVSDASSAVQLDGNRKRWLHSSIPLRSNAIHSYQLSILAFGLDHSGRGSLASDSRHSKQNLTNGEKAITVIVCCILEQFSWNREQNDSSEDWGTVKERVDLIVTAADTLSATLNSCGVYLSMSTRCLIDSAAETGLAATISLRGPQLASWSQVKVALLRLACGCLSTPYPDGASSSAMYTMRHFGAELARDRDEKVILAAKSLTSLCDALSVPRAPPLTVPTRKVSNSTALFTAPPAGSIMEQIAQARNELAASAKDDAGPETAKRRAKRSEISSESIATGSDDAARKKRPKTIQLSIDAATAAAASAAAVPPSTPPNTPIPSVLTARPFEDTTTECQAPKLPISKELFAEDTKPSASTKSNRDRVAKSDTQKLLEKKCAPVASSFPSTSQEKDNESDAKPSNANEEEEKTKEDPGRVNDESGGSRVAVDREQPASSVMEPERIQPHLPPEAKEQAQEGSGSGPARTNARDDTPGGDGTPKGQTAAREESDGESDDLPPIFVDGGPDDDDM